MRLKRNVTYAGLMAVCLLQCMDGRDKATSEGNSAKATTPTRPDARRAMTKGEALSAIRRANAKVRERLATFREVASSDMAVILAVLGQRGVSEDPKSREIVYKRCVMQCTGASSAWREYEKTAAPGRAVKVYVEHYLDAVSNGKGILTFARQANRLVFVEAESLRYY